MARLGSSGVSAPIAALDMFPAAHRTGLLAGGIQNVIFGLHHIIAGAPGTDDDDKCRKEQFLEHDE